MKSYPNRYTNKKLTKDTYGNSPTHKKRRVYTSKEKVIHQTEIYPFRNCMSTNVFKNSKQKYANIKLEVKGQGHEGTQHDTPCANFGLPISKSKDDIALADKFMVKI